ncbi:MAG TPA: hypothetical protein VHA13_02935 [Gammaproteobacteria bacterium]|nr:hypothetical protein [Gammaproteobacteria bacterium]
MLLGTLAILASTVLAIASIFTPEGLLITLGCGLFTSGENWGPLTVANKTFNWGVDLMMFGGPDKEQRQAAENLSSYAQELKKEVEAINKPATARA